MKEVKILKASDLIAAGVENNPPVQHIDFYGQDIEVAMSIPMEVEFSLIEQVVDASFSENAGVYMPENRLFATRLAVLAAFTNIELSNSEEEMALLVYRSGVFEVVEGVLHGSTQYADMLTAIQDRCNVILDANRKAFERSLNDAISAIGVLVNNVGDVLNGVTPEELTAMLTAVDEKGIDEGKIVQAVIAERNKEENNG